MDPQQFATKQDSYDTEARVGRLLLQIAEVQMHTTEQLEKVTGRLDRLADAQQQLAEAQQHTEERLNTLISIVDDLVRRQPRN